MVKHMNNSKYHYQGKLYDLKSLYSKLQREKTITSKQEIMGSVLVSSHKIILK